jgi:hypothetical protein
LARSFLLLGGVVLLFVGLSALLAYMLTTGQYPPRLPRDAVELPADDVEDTGKSLEVVQESLRELAERVEHIEDEVGIRENELT